VRCCRRYLALLACLLLAACQSAPVPHKTALAPLPDAPGVTVLPVEGLPPPQARAVALAMADALADRNIPAAIEGSNRKSRFVAATARVESAAGGAMRLHIGWRLIARDGAVLGWHRAAMTVPRALWTHPQSKPFRDVADGAATRFAALIQAPDIASAPAAPPPARPSLHVWPVEGAPKGGDGLLQHEMELALRRNGHQVTGTIEPATLVVSGTVELGPPEAGRRTLTVSWAVLDWRGRELGTLTQRNQVPANEVESGWRRFAALIAEAAAGGIGELLRKSGKEGEESGPVAFTGGGAAGKVRAPRDSRPAPSR